MNFYDDFVIKCSPTGSNFICNPPVTNTDIDTVFLVRPEATDETSGFSESYDYCLASSGWVPCVGEGYEILGGDFSAWRKGNKNYIVTTDPEYYKKYVLATRICKMMNLLEKKDRIFMFELVMHGKGLPSKEDPLAFFANMNANIDAYNQADAAGTATLGEILNW